MLSIRLIISVVLTALFAVTAFVMLLAFSPVKEANAATTICVNGTPISAALASAQAGDTIRVAAGIYTEFVTITKTVTLLGGWNADCTLRDIDSNVTILRPPDPSFSVVTIQGQFGNPAAVAPTFDGFTVTGGGGGNHGGGLRLVDSNAIVSSNIITGNIAFLFGGGIWVQRGAPLIQDNRVENNRVTPDSAYGGGIELENTQATLVGNLVANNVVSGSVGYGGGIAILDGGPVTLINNTIVRNSAADQMGGATDQGFGGGVFISLSDVTIERGQIADNTVSLDCEGFGGGLHAYTSTLTLDATLIENNCAANTPAKGQGAGLAFLSSPFILSNALIIENGSLANDTAVGGIYADGSSPGLLVNNTLGDNKGQGIQTASMLTLTNTIILGHTTGVSLTAAVSVSATYNDFFANTVNQRGFSLDANNLLDDPQLDATYHLESTSPLLDAGAFTNVTHQDIDGEPRAMAGPSGLFKIDIGADERAGGLQKVYDLINGVADFTIIGPGGQDPVVNGVNDWIGSALLGNDINGDGRADLVVSAHDWAQDPDNAPFTTGRVFGLFNTGTRITGTLDLLTNTADLTVVSQLKLQHIGSEFAGGDLNDDGYDDLIIGSSQDDGGGGGTVTPTVFALWGDPTLLGTRTLSTTTPADFMLRAPGQDFFAFSAKNALTTGDLDGNGVVDLIVGDALANDDALAQAGAVFVIFGRNDLSGLHDLSITPADYTLYGPAANAFLGLVAVGRMNNDEHLDLIARTATAAHVIFGPFSGGSLHLDTTPANVTISGLQGGGVIVTDLTGDGQDDLILGSNDSLYVIPGPFASGDNFNAASRAVLVLTHIPAEALAVGHVVGDAEPDLIASSRMLKKVYIVAGALAVSGTLPIAEVAHTVVDVELSTSLFSDVGVGDLDFDKRPDLFISTARDIESHPDKYKDAGVVYVLYNTGSLPSIPNPTPQSIHLPNVRR